MKTTMETSYPSYVWTIAQKYVMTYWYRSNKSKIYSWKVFDTLEEANAEKSSFDAQYGGGDYNIDSAINPGYTLMYSGTSEEVYGYYISLSDAQAAMSKCEASYGSLFVSAEIVPID